MVAHDSSNLPEQGWARAYRGEMLAVIVGYSITLTLTIMFVDRLSGAPRYAVALAPMLPFVALPWVVMRAQRRVDERERDLGYRTFTFGFFGTAVVTFAYGFLELAGAPRLSMFAVWPVMGVLWIVGRVAASRMP